MDSIDRGWTFIKNAYALAFEHKSLLLPILYGGLVSLLFSAICLGILAAVWWASGHPFGETGRDLGAWLSRYRALVAFVAVVLLAGNLMITYFFKGMTVSMVDAYLKGRDANVGVAWRDALRNRRALAVLAIVGTVIEMVVASARRQTRNSLGLDGLLIDSTARLVETTWTVVSFLLLPVIIVEDIDFGKAIARVRDIHRQNLVQIGVGEVGIRLVAWMAGSCFTLVMTGLGYLLYPLGLPGIIAHVIIFLIGISTLNVLHAFGKACYYTCLYLWAVEVERAPEPSQALIPAPLAAAFI